MLRNHSHHKLPRSVPPQSTSHKQKRSKDKKKTNLPLPQQTSSPPPPPTPPRPKPNTRTSPRRPPPSKPPTPNTPAQPAAAPDRVEPPSSQTPTSSTRAPAEHIIHAPTRAVHAEERIRSIAIGIRGRFMERIRNVIVDCRVDKVARGLERFGLVMEFGSVRLGGVGIEVVIGRGGVSRRGR